MRNRTLLEAVTEVDFHDDTIIQHTAPVVVYENSSIHHKSLVTSNKTDSQNKNEMTAGRSLSNNISLPRGSTGGAYSKGTDMYTPTHQTTTRVQSDTVSPPWDVRAETSQALQKRIIAVHR